MPGSGGPAAAFCAEPALGETALETPFEIVAGKAAETPPKVAGPDAAGVDEDPAGAPRPAWFPRVFRTAKVRGDAPEPICMAAVSGEAVKAA